MRLRLPFLILIAGPFSSRLPRYTTPWATGDVMAAAGAKPVETRHIHRMAYGGLASSGRASVAISPSRLGERRPRCDRRGIAAGTIRGAE